MQLNQLAAFVAVVEQGTVIEAAEKLHIAQPAVSRYIRRLEDELGFPLFEHRGRQLRLTPFGRWAYERARRILEEASLLSRSQRLPALYVGASLLTLPTFLPRVIERFRQLASDVELHVETGLSGEVYESVAHGRIEVGMVSDAHARPHLRVVPLFTDHLWFLYPRAGSWSRREAVRVEELSQFPLVLMSPKTVIRAELDRLFRRHQVHPDIRMEVDNVDVIQRVVAAGLGATILPRSVCLPALHGDGWYAAPLIVGPEATEPLDGLSRTFGLITLDAAVSPLAEIWIELCKTVAAEFAVAESR